MLDFLRVAQIRDAGQFPKKSRQQLSVAVPGGNHNCISAFQGAFRPSIAPVVPAVFGYAEMSPYEFNPEKAKELLAATGHEDGFEIALFHPTGRYPGDATVIEAVQAMLAEVGVTATLETLEWGTCLDTVIVAPEEAQHDIFMLGWGTVTLDADYGLYALFHSSQRPPANNVSYYPKFPQVYDYGTLKT